MKNVPRCSRSVRFLFWLTGFVVFAGFAFLPPVLGNGLKAAAIGVVFCAVPLIGIAATLARLIFLVQNGRWTAAWVWWAARTIGVHSWRAVWRTLRWARYSVYLLRLRFGKAAKSGAENIQGLRA